MANLKFFIKFDVADLVNDIRRYSERQEWLWQKVPYLALQADGRSGYNGSYALAYGRGYWPLDESIKEGCYTIYVDLETGKLVSAYDPRKPANDKDILNIAADLDDIDASLIVKELMEKSKQPYISCYDARAQNKWRTNLLKELELCEGSYKRKTNPQKVYEANVVAGLVG